jgi:hypothetical protein
MTAAYFEDHPTDPEKVILRKPSLEQAFAEFAKQFGEYKAPDNSRWVGLTDEDRLEFAKAQLSWEDLLIAAEAKLKEKNNG